MVIAAAAPSSRVAPSGSARATVDAASVPPPPGRLSTTTGCLTLAASVSPTVRASTSAAPPAASGVTILIGRVGHSWAGAAPGVARIRPAAISQRANGTDTDVSYVGAGY